MIGRKRKKAAAAAEDAEQSAAADPPTEVPPAQDESGLFDRSSGPHDITEVAQSDARTAQRLDLGALQLPLLDQMEIRVEMDQESGEPMGVLVVLEDGMVQVRAFAAPRSGGGWEEARQDIRRSLAGGGGTVDEREGRFGTELHASVQLTDDEGRTGMQRMRFVGVDGPRWMVQATLYGAGAVPEQAQPIEEVLRSLVVVRGDAAMPPGTPLTLTLPEGAHEDSEPEVDGDHDE